MTTATRCRDHEWNDQPHPHPEIEPAPTIDRAQPWFALHCRTPDCPAIALLHPAWGDGTIYEVLNEQADHPEPEPLYRNEDILQAINEERQARLYEEEPPA